MEGSPPAAENTPPAPEAKEPKKSKKKRAGEFGAFLVEAKEPQAAAETAEKPRKRLFDFFKKDSDPGTNKPEAEKESKTDSFLAELSKKEIEPATEAEAPTEQAGEEEAHDISKVFAQERPVEGSPVDSFHDKITQEDKSVDQAFAETMDELGLSPAEAAMLDAEPAIEPLPAETSAEETPAETESPTFELPSQPVAEASPIAPAAEIVPESPSEAAEPEPPTPPVTVAPPPIIPPNLPPTPNTPPTPPVPPHIRMAAMLPPTSPVEAPTHITSGNVHAPEYDRGNPAVTALVGGIVGYLIGRRRGRINTEKKLLPVQKKLKHQVEGLEWQLADKEAKIRRAAARVKNPAEVRGGLFNFDKSRNTLGKNIHSEQIHNSEQPARGASAESLHAAAPTSEHIGHMLVNNSTETEPQNRFNLPLPVPEQRPAPTAAIAESNMRAINQAEKIPPTIGTEKRVETMNRADLLSLSEKITVDGTTLRHIYETHLIGEQGLRRLVAENLRGGDVSQALRHEIVQKQTDFERDPRMRDAHADDSPTGSAAAPLAGQEKLNQLLQVAGSNVGDGNPEPAFYQAQADQQAAAQARKQQKRRWADIGLVGIITVLIVLVVALYLTR
ncbi:MAG TPA: hypothetical protein VG604_03820 [Candidatus Saccharimonadales bacterium]|nr:hypothetical protein [Candidatus Saccharimonadales bacterium]